MRFTFTADRHNLTLTWEMSKSLELNIAVLILYGTQINGIDLVTFSKKEPTFLNPKKLTQFLKFSSQKKQRDVSLFWSWTYRHLESTNQPIKFIYYFRKLFVCLKRPMSSSELRC